MDGEGNCGWRGELWMDRGIGDGEGNCGWGIEKGSVIQIRRCRRSMKLSWKIKKKLDIEEFGA